MKRLILVFLSFVAVFGGLFSGIANARSTDPEIRMLSSKIVEGLAGKHIKRIAVVDFVDMQHHSTELGKYLAEQLSVEIVNSEEVKVVDRANIRSILLEHNLSVEGLINPENAREFGKISGADAILTGTIVNLDTDLELTLKLISVESAQIVTAAKASFRNSPEFQKLSTRLALPERESSRKREHERGESRQEIDGIAVKELGDLRVALKSARVIAGGYDSQQIQLVFDLVDMNTKDDLLVAAVRVYNNGQMLLKTQVVDSIGQAWELARVSGLSEIKGNQDTPTGESLMQNVLYGRHMTGGEVTYRLSDRPWWGAFSEVTSEQSKSVTMLFQKPGQDAYVKKVGDSLQFECELIVGKGTAEKPGNCIFGTLVFDRVKLAE